MLGKSTPFTVRLLSWVGYIQPTVRLKSHFNLHLSLLQVPTVYVDPVITGDLELDNVLGHLSFTMKLSLFWQDFRLVIRLVFMVEYFA